MPLSDHWDIFGSSSMGRRSSTRESTEIKNAARRLGRHTPEGRKMMARAAEVSLSEPTRMTPEFRELRETAQEIRAAQQSGGFDYAADIKPLRQQWFQTVGTSDTLTQREKQKLRDRYNAEFSVLGEQQDKERDRAVKGQLDQLSLQSGQQGLLKGDIDIRSGEQGLRIGEQNLTRGGLAIDQAGLNIQGAALDLEIGRNRLQTGKASFEEGERDKKRRERGDAYLPDLAAFLKKINRQSTGWTKNEAGKWIEGPSDPPEILQSKVLNYFNTRPDLAYSPAGVKMVENAFGKVGGDLTFFRQMKTRDDAAINQMVANAANAGITVTKEGKTINQIITAVSKGFDTIKNAAIAKASEKVWVHGKVRAMENYSDAIRLWVKDLPAEGDDIPGGMSKEGAKVYMKSFLTAAFSIANPLSDKDSDGEDSKAKASILAGLEKLGTQIDPGTSWLTKKGKGDPDTDKIAALIRNIGLQIRLADAAYADELIGASRKAGYGDSMPGEKKTQYDKLFE